MSPSLRACIQLVALLAGAALLIMVAMMDARTSAADYAVGVCVAAVMVGALAVLFWAGRRPDIAPDLLCNHFGDYFDHDGFCFVIRSRVAQQMLWMDVWFQNRFEGECEAIVAVAPQRGFFLTRGEGITLRLPLRIPGGAFGMASIPLEVPAGNIAKRVKLDVTARARYVSGKGKRLRYRAGLQVGKVESPNWERLGLALNLIIAPTGSMAMSHPASTAIEIPLGDYRSPPADFVVKPVIYWRPGEPLPSAPIDR